VADLSLFDLTGKKALVTGGSKGIGRGVAIALAKAGADVAVVGRDGGKGGAGHKVVELLRSMGRDAVYIQCDVADKRQVNNMMRVIIERFGRLDIAINNAATPDSSTADEIQEQDNFDQVIAVNLTGTWLCAQAEAKQMMKQHPAGGKIINVSSIAAVSALAES